MRLSIGELASATNETVKTLRYWTDLGLLEGERGDNGYRYYLPDMARRVSFIRTTQSLGFNLKEIREIVAVRSSGVEPCEEVRQQLSAHLVAVRGRIAELRRLEGQLAARLQWAQAHPDPDCYEDGCVYLTQGSTSPA